MAAWRPLVFSVPTSAGGATAAATMTFFTSDYKPPRQGRSTAQDVVHNQNGVFKYRYDNGPNVRQWQSFRIQIRDDFKQYLGGATLQWSRLNFLWNYTEGPIGMRTPDGTYSVDWTDAPLEPNAEFAPYAGDKGEWDRDVIVSFEEG